MDVISCFTFDGFYELYASEFQASSKQNFEKHKADFKGHLLSADQQQWFMYRAGAR